ncbi:MAG: LacI family DNA-binding transcriptional regulator [Acidimicrobiales bacterium]
MAPSSRPTLHDVAARAGVSARTVSRVVNGESVVSEATATVVQAAIDDLGYRPNLAARSLINRRSGMIALLVTSMNNPFFGEFADAVRAAAAARGLTLVLASSDDDPAAQERLLRKLESHSIEGVIGWCAAGGQASIVELAGRGTPFVLVNDQLDAPGVSSVSVDHDQGARLAVAHLIERGHRHLGMLAGEFVDERLGPREVGFTEACAAAGVEARIVDAPHTVEGGAGALRRLLELEPGTTAVFALNDLMAAGAMQACAELGLAVPADVAVVGCDDIQLSSLLHPPLTTVRNDPRALGERAVAALVAVIDGAEPDPEPELLEVELVVRASS